MPKEKRRFHIRTMTIEDIPAIPALLKFCDLFRESGDTAENLKRKLAYDPDLTVVAVIEDKLIGCMMASYDGWAATIWHYGIPPKFHSMGVARALEKEVHKRIMHKHRILSRKAGVGEGENLKVYGLILSDKKAVLRLLTHKGFSRGPEVFVVCHDTAEDP